MDTEQLQQLTPTDHALLGREAAADSYRAGGYVYDPVQIRRAFSDGWDAAVEWMKENPTDDTCCHFQD